MNRNYLPPSLMGHAPPPPDTADVVMVTMPSSPGAGAGEGPASSANTNASQSQHQVHPLFAGYQTLPHQHPQHHHHPQAASLANVSCALPAPSGTGGAANPGTRRSISFTGGVPIASSSIGGHAFLSHQYTHMLPPAVPQVAHQSTTYPQIALAQSGSNLGYVTVPGGGPQSPSPTQQPPTRVGRMDRFSRTCKLPTVQEVGKLRPAGSSSSSYSSSSASSSSQARSTAKSNHRSLYPGRKCLTIR